MLVGITYHRGQPLRRSGIIHTIHELATQGKSIFPHAALELLEDVAAPSFRIGNQPGQDLLPLSLERVLGGVVALSLTLIFCK